MSSILSVFFSCARALQRMKNFYIELMRWSTSCGIVAQKIKSNFSWMEIAFLTRHLRDLSLKGELAILEFGEELAAKFHNRLADLAAANNVYDLIAGKPRHGADEGKEFYIVNFSKDHVMVFVPNHIKIPMLDLGIVDWSKVNRVKVIKVGEENG